MVTIEQLRGLGWTDDQVRYAAARGRLIRLHRGVYAVGHTRLLPQGRWLGAVLACGRGAALSHASAAAHLDLRRSASRVVDVTVPSARRHHDGVRVHRPRRLEPGDVVVHRGIPTTSPTRTLIDLSRNLSLPALERVAAEAEHRGLLDHGRLALARSPKLRAIFAEAPARARSRHEARLLAALREAGIRAEANVWITHGGGEEWQADVLFRRERVIVEVDDGRHRTRHAFELDRRKDAVRQADGFRTLRFTHRQLDTDLAGAVALVQATLAASVSRNR